MLTEARSLLKWCQQSKRWIPTNPLDGVEGVGKRKHGKPQLRIDEARRWLAKANELASGGDEGAVAAMVALLLGMRATEIITRVVRDVDDAGNQIWIPSSKTENGKRTLRVPPELREHLLRLVESKAPGELLFGPHWRDWVRKSVKRICTESGVPPVSAHSMRGLHATLAMEAGVTGAVVAASLGQGSASVSHRSVVRRSGGSVLGQTARRSAGPGRRQHRLTARHGTAGRDPPKLLLRFGGCWRRSFTRLAGAQRAGAGRTGGCTRD